MNNLINLILNLVFFFTWAWTSFDLITENPENNPVILIIYAFIICFIMLVVATLLIGFLIGLFTVKLKLHQLATQKYKFILELEEKGIDEKSIILESPEIVCVFKDKKFSKQIKFADRLYNFDSIVHTNKDGKYLITEELPIDAIILNPGGIYVPEKIIQS